MKKQIFWHEVNILRLINHERFAKLLGILIGENFGIISEFIEGETLDKILNSRNLLVSEGIKWIGELIEGMAFLQSKKIVHKDLKPANLIISERGLVIIDLGISSVTKLYCGKEQVLTTSIFRRKGGTL